MYVLREGTNYFISIFNFLISIIISGKNKHWFYKIEITLPIITQCIV